ncbi:hypothetical protein EDI_161510 [Entamoeba dispar SAW760]|uniref:Uncharacterized protein n=1 Tax=Entamoeba dispar (strain ATCC PRA-260 / SAW760) TaxID=370354 RepID=B0EUR2_ENTDS|nr:uncharacterized protein EDI_161510 [Entamoeba dispar SAW760]EDR21706.1 hypothetical protein EDI_161510 [Entamoeba dispar SAW760]|eukprot:EDR21706.1 hypothetical protein EDI_161510 [Entamoeba dispar SAW760]
MLQISWTFIYFLFPLFCLTTYISLDTGFTQCHSDFNQLKRTGIYQLLNPQIISKILLLIIVVVCSIRITRTHTIVIISIIIEFLNAYILFSSLYTLIIISKMYMNDKKCSLNESKNNGISGHYFTYIYYFQVLTHLVDSISLELKNPFFIFFATEVFQIQTTKFFEFNFHPFQKSKSFQSVIGMMLFFGYILFSWGTLFDTLIIGYHTPRQAILGTVLGILSTLLYQLFLQVPFKFQSLLNSFFLIIVIGCYYILTQEILNGIVCVLAITSLILTVVIEYYNNYQHIDSSLILI